MNAQSLEFIRQTLEIATADLSGSTKGQIVTLAENCMFTNERYPRKPLKVEDPERPGKMITLLNQPVPGKQSRAKGSHIPQILPVEYSTASWRRAVALLPEHEQAWIRWCYAADTAYGYQVQITRWAWEAFEDRLKGKRVARKTLERLRALVWLAAQDVNRELHGKTELCYQQQHLAELVGVNPTNWAQNYARHWEALTGLFRRLDEAALRGVSRVRACQKRENFAKDLQK